MSAVIEPNLHFRPISESDLDTIVAVESCAYQFPWSKKIFRDCVRVGYHCWLLEEFNRLVGYGIMTMAAGECHILNLCVKPERQHEGFGAMLMEFLLDTASQFNTDTVFLEVRPSNTYAIKLYQRLGFDEVGIRKDYYPGVPVREDALILAKTIIKQ